jgi:hypothetical protein
MSGFDGQLDYRTNDSREQQDSVHNHPDLNAGDTGVNAGAGPTLPPDWAWICCDQDHGSSSRIMANHDSTTTPMISASSSPTINTFHQPQPPQDHLMTHRHSRSGSRSAFASPTGSTFPHGQARPNGHVHMHAQAKEHQGRPKNRSNRSSDFSASDRLSARRESLSGPGLEYQGGSVKRSSRDRRSGLANSLSIAVPGSQQQFYGTSVIASPIIQGVASKPGSRASTPGGLDPSSQPHDSQGLRSLNSDHPYASTRAGHDGSSSNPIIVGIPGVGSMNPGPTEAQLAQWMTYCCDKDDCQDPFPPPASTGLATPANGVLDLNGNLGDAQQSAAGMFNQFLPGANPMMIDVSSNGQGQSMLEPYCCGGGPDCHEPIIDSIGCEGHPQSCGLPACCPPQAMSMATRANDIHKEPLELFMKGVDWECLDADCMALHSFVSGVSSIRAAFDNT